MASVNKKSIFILKELVSYRYKNSSLKQLQALVKQEDIENADYNLSVSTYVESEDTREVIDIDVLNKQISEIVQRENTLRAEIDAIIAEIEEA